MTDTEERFLLWAAMLGVRVASVELQLDKLLNGYLGIAVENAGEGHVEGFVILLRGGAPVFIDEWFPHLAAACMEPDTDISMDVPRIVERVAALMPFVIDAEDYPTIEAPFAALCDERPELRPHYERAKMRAAWEANL